MIEHNNQFRVLRRRHSKLLIAFHESNLYYFDHVQLMEPKISDEKAVKYYEEVLRLMNEMVVLLKESNTAQKQHNRIIEELNERVRKISVNTNQYR